MDPPSYAEKEETEQSQTPLMDQAKSPAKSPYPQMTPVTTPGASGGDVASPDAVNFAPPPQADPGYGYGGAMGQWGPGQAGPPGSWGSVQAPPGHSHTSNTNTTVVVQQPMQVIHKPARLWTSGMMSCCDDMGVCCCGTFCGCCLATQVATDMGESYCVPCCVPGWLIVLRTKMRVQQNISGSVLDDCCAVCCCGPCALCQLAREIKFCRNTGTMVIT